MFSKEKTDNGNDPNMTQMLKLSDKGFKAAVITMINKQQVPSE